mmetsp:Transcript_35442/g.93130  ORF Transcript_35442/g.93130 Transcript_35442/m.93130 type:complete len:92 (-) Transcript_35442:366-641(-)
MEALDYVSERDSEEICSVRSDDDGMRDDWDRCSVISWKGKKIDPLVISASKVPAVGKGQKPPPVTPSIFNLPVQDASRNRNTSNSRKNFIF